VASLILKCNINILIRFYEHIVFFFFYKVFIFNSVSSLINGHVKWLDPQLPDSGSAPDTSTTVMYYSKEVLSKLLHASLSDISRTYWYRLCPQASLWCRAYNRFPLLNRVYVLNLSLWSRFVVAVCRLPRYNFNNFFIRPP
jgi:hypothetical protein